VFGGDAVETCARATCMEFDASGTQISCEVSLKINGRGTAMTGDALLLLPGS